MKKYFLSLVLFSQTILFGQATAPNPFTKLTPTIYNHAHTWSTKVVDTLNDDLQLTFLNLFALNSENLIQAFIKCAEYIESQKEMLSLYEELGMDIMEVLKTYAENIQEKISKKNISDKEKQALGEKLHIKIQELLAYINTIYYQELHTQMAKKNSSLMYMFDENGIIVAEKRTRSLPQII